MPDTNNTNGFHDDCNSNASGDEVRGIMLFSVCLPVIINCCLKTYYKVQNVDSVKLL